MTILPLASRAKTGIAGLDDVLGGGLPANRIYLLEGNPGSGKTTVALQFLLEGARNGESGLYVTLSETTAELHEVAADESRPSGAQKQQVRDAAEKNRSQEINSPNLGLGRKSSIMPKDPATDVGFLGLGSIIED